MTAERNTAGSTGETRARARGPRKPRPGRSLAELRPDIAAQWHPTKNGTLTPADVTVSSNVKVWWLAGCDHPAFEQAPHHRSKGVGCPKCAIDARARIRRTPKAGESLADKRPDVARWWDASKNGGLTARDVKPSSNTKRHWRDEFGHEWQAACNTMLVAGRGCPICSGRKVLAGTNDLSTTHPMVAMDWAADLNEFGPQDVSAGSNRRAWWRDANGHEWQAVIASRVSGNGCPTCGREQSALTRRKARPGRSLQELRPELAAQFHPTKNATLDPRRLHVSTRTQVWWLGECGHEWLQAVSQRHNGNSGCPVCAGKLVVAGINDLETTHPSDAAQWHPTMNGKLSPSAVSAGSERTAWWLGRCGHHWSSTVLSRTNGTGSCPFCTGRRVLLGFNDLATARPDIAAEWHPTRNGNREATSLTSASQFQAWWMCAAGHEWKAKVGNRTVLGTGCAACKKSGTSGAEKALAEALSAVLDAVQQGAPVEDVKLGRYKRTARVDVLARIEDRRVAVEYDGSYWHAGREDSDNRKTDALIAAGLLVVRIREQPLPLLMARPNLVQLSTPWLPADSRRGRALYEETARTVLQAVLEAITGAKGTRASG